MISAAEIQQRYLLLQDWLQEVLSTDYDISLLAGDASFRRYYRLHLPDSTLIAMDAPPALEDSQAFAALCQIFDKQGLAVPKILAKDLTQGFLLLSDFGDDLYFKVLTAENFQQLYRNAMEQLLILQSCPPCADWSLPVFDHALFHTELSRFKEWYLTKYRQITLTKTEEKLVDKLFENLIDTALAQPQVCVHRDYHSRNLFALPNNQVGIIDFQDALWGPITYDLVSLLRDCYIVWPATDILQLANSFYHQLQASTAMPNYAQEQFIRDLDWMGVQRHLKASYIFARKYCRDANDGYLDDIPRTLNYVYEVCKTYPKLADFQLFLEEKILS